MDYAFTVVFYCGKKVFSHTSFDYASVENDFQIQKRAKELTSSANKRDDKQDTANFHCLSKVNHFEKVAVM